MAEKIADGLWKCTYCEREFNNSAKADACFEDHNLILLPIAKEDIKRLITFIYVGDPEILPQRLIKTLMKFNSLTSKNE
jgi:hypothetical protein